LLTLSDDKGANSDGDAIVYDNKMGAEEDADPTTAIGGGSIVIHTKKKQMRQS